MSSAPQCKARKTIHWPSLPSLAVLVTVIVLLWQGHTAYRVSVQREVLNRTNRLWLDTINRVPAAIMIIDADTGLIVGASESAETLLGWSPNELTGASLFTLMPDELARKHIDRLRSETVRARLSEEAVKLTCLLHCKDSPKQLLCSIIIRGVSGPDRYRFLLVVEKAESFQELPGIAEISLSPKTDRPVPDKQVLLNLLPDGKRK